MNAIKIIVLIIAAIVVGQTTNWEAADQVAVALIVLLVLAWSWSRFSLRGLTVNRRVASDRTQVGQLLTEQVEIRNGGRLGRLWLEVLDQSTLPNHAVSRVVNVPRQGAIAWEVVTRCVRRGRYRLGPLAFRSGDPLGIFPKRSVAPELQEIIVYPAVIPLESVPVPTGLLAGGDALDRRTPFTTPNIAGVREYSPGDAFNRISWSTTARTGRLMVKEFDLDPTADIWLVLDLQGGVHRTASRPLNFVPNADGAFPLEAWLDSTEEYAVTIVASLAGHFLRQRRNVGLIASGVHLEVIAPDRSDRQLVKILEDLAVATADGGLSLGEVLVAEGRRFSRHDSLVVVTPSTDESWVATLAEISGKRVRTAAVLVEPETFAHAPSSLMAISGLVAAGIPAQLVKYGDDIAATLAVAPGTMAGRYRG
ncbi:MAG: DUF58 domain-containing protein [Chloroflexia bacterium]|nr:DUF58 domain-containing protein [Chloroflexia bacterium]MDQ3411138.1 DUF58 domain-containing protein [Chloroflexota bacterium]